MYLYPVKFGSKRQFLAGFTLIELLVVIAIIGVLGTASVMYFNHSRARSRDAGRVSDVQKMQDAVELYIEDNEEDQGGPPNVTSWAEFVEAINPYYKGDFSGADGNHPYAYCRKSDINDTERYMVAALLEGDEDINGDLDGSQYTCGECVFSAGSCIEIETLNCDDDSAGKIIYNGTAFCLGRASQ